MLLTPSCCAPHLGSCPAQVLASCSVDGTVRIWDTRERGRSMLSVAASTTDVNVISWSRLTTYILASGDNAGVMRVWDLRNLADGAHVANFAYHRWEALPTSKHMQARCLPGLDWGRHPVCHCQSAFILGLFGHCTGAGKFDLGQVTGHCLLQTRSLLVDAAHVASHADSL